jgi:hypothetical protein
MFSPVTKTPVKKEKTVKKEKAVKKETKQDIKAEVKEEVKSEYSTPTKRPRAISAEMSIRKRPGATATRAHAALGSPVAEEDAGEQLETLDALLEGSASAGEAGNDEV